MGEGLNCQGGRTNRGMRGLKTWLFDAGATTRFLAKCVLPAFIKSVALLTIAVSSAHAADRQWASASAGGDWNTASNWTEADVPDTSAESAVFHAGTANRAFTFSQPNTTIGSLTIDNPTSGSATNTINGTTAGVPSLTFDSPDSNPATINVVGNYGGSIASTANIHSLTGPVILNDNLVIDLAPKTTDYAAIILSFRTSANSAITGPGGITKNGLGTLVFADTQKAFQGPLIINQGRLRFNGTSGLSQTSSVTVNPGGQLNFEQGTVGGSNVNITLGTATTVVTLNGLGTVEPPSGSGAYTPGAIRAGGGIVQGGFTQTLTNAVTLASDAAINVLNNVNFTTGALVNAGTLTLANSVSGPGKLIAQELAGSPLSGGTLVLANSNSYTGGTKINLGTLLVSNANNGIANLGSGDVYVDGATSQANSNSSQFPTLAAGRLQIQTGVVNAIANSATLTLTGDTATYLGVGDSAVGGIAILETGINETVGGLVFGASPQNYGLTYGSTASSAVIKSDTYFGSTFTGIITVGTAGDYNHNGQVDAADYVIWRKNPAGYGDSAGYNLWRQNFGNMSSPGAGAGLSGNQAVPEPSTLLLTVAGVSLARVGRRRRAPMRTMPKCRK
jgi:autotransporter-associated beta strand protein